jgi:hypothetical protein
VLKLRTAPNIIHISTSVNTIGKIRAKKKKNHRLEDEGFNNLNTEKPNPTTMVLSVEDQDH